jgi:DNA-binding XRE family transcriptional regulator
MKAESKQRPKTQRHRDSVGALKRVTVKGQRMVVLPEDEYDRLLRKADEWEPLLPTPNDRGNYPVEALDVLLARKLLRRRRAAGLTQAELARRSGIRAETLCRIEQGDRSPSVRTVDKIDRALREAETK